MSMSSTEADVALSRGERLSVILEERLDIPMAVLAVLWAGIVTYELVVPEPVNGLVVLGNVQCGCSGSSPQHAWSARRTGRSAPLAHSSTDDSPS